MEQEFKLPSGASLKYNLAPFKEGRDLYQIVIREMKDVPFNSKREIGEVLKDLALIAMSSKEIEVAIWACLKRARYNDIKITEETFESVDARGDYMTVCFEVAKANLEPFMKSLYAKYGHLLGMTPKSPA